MAQISSRIKIFKMRLTMNTMIINKKMIWFITRQQNPKKGKDRISIPKSHIITTLINPHFKKDLKTRFKTKRSNNSK